MECNFELGNIFWGHLIAYTVVKRGHTEGIEREKTSSQKSQGISIKIWGYLPTEGNTLKFRMPSYSDFKYLQKMNAKCPQISDEK